MFCHRCGEGGHNGEACPHFPQERSLHGDAWNYFHNAPELEQGAGDTTQLLGAVVERQPGDGHCLSHSLAVGLAEYGAQSTGGELRQELAEWLWTHDHIEVSENNFHAVYL